MSLFYPNVGSTGIGGSGGGTGTVTSVSVSSANGFAGTVTNPTTTPAITISTTITGLLKGNGTAISAAVSGTDYQPAGNYVTSLTGDVTGSGPGATAATLATVNGSPGSFGSASTSLSATVNGKGLITALSSQAILIAESQVTGLVSDLASKQSTTLTSAHLLVGNGSNVATDVAASGDLTLANTGAFTVAKIQSTVVSGTTGSGNVVFSASPTLTSPALGTPSALIGTNITGTAAGLTAGNVTTNANLTGPITSIGNATSVASQTGTGSTFVMNTAPTMTNPIVGTQSQGDSSTKAASTSYVDIAVANAVAGVNPAVAVQAATTAASDTSGFTYNNGASGIGATLTGVANTVLTVDGYTFTAVGQRLLVKNDTQSPSGAYNGIYNVTQIQTAILPIILTRALDYDQPSDMNNTGAIPVINGTANGTTSWVLTSLVVTVGTTPLTFTEFTRNPADYLLKANNLSDVASKPTSRVNLNIDQRHAVADADYVILSTDRYVGLASITASRVFTLPAANSVNAGQTLIVADESGSLVSGSITATIQRAGADTVDGATSFVLGFPYALVVFVSDGTAKWTYDVTGTGRGGTGSKTIAGARANLNIDKRTTFSNAAYVVLTTDKYVAQVGTMSASRAVTMPAANAVNPGQEFIIQDESGSVTSTNTIVVTAAGADTIDGAATVTIMAPYAQRRLFSDGTSKWSFDASVVRTSNTASVDSEVAIYSSTGGQIIKRATGTGVAHLTSGVLSASNVVLTSEVTGVLPNANGGVFTPIFNYYTSSTTMADPGSGCTILRVRALAGGGGGGSGRKGLTSSARSGGGGGSAGAWIDVEFPYSSVGSWPVTITIGAGGAGGTAQATDSTQGVVGTNGGNTSFGSVVVALGGQGGQGGQATAVNASGGLWRIGSMTITGNTNSINSTSGGYGGNSTVGTIGAGASGMAGSGAGGAGATASNAVTAGQAGGANGNGTAGGAGGGAGANGSNGAAGDSSAPYIFPGGSGGGGPGSSTTAAFTGGNGGLYGAAGAGGSCGTDTVNSSGAGGSGANGILIVIAK